VASKTNKLKTASAKDKAWKLFDRIVELAAPGGSHTNPWYMGPDKQLSYGPDYATLVKLLGVPLELKAPTTSGVPALALDVWLSYELRRAGFDKEAVWPRAEHPRILPAPVAKLLSEVKGPLKNELNKFVQGAQSIKGVTSSSANILGKNYLKQVDVIMSDWVTGPELLISTKRMDSSYGKNAANRVEESYGDAKNLRLRHPLAALGFVFGLRSDILQKEPDVAEWLVDLLAKLGREDDAYHATCLILIEYADIEAVLDTGEEPPVTAVPQPGVEEELAQYDVQTEEGFQLEAGTVPSYASLDSVIDNLPRVAIVQDRVPDVLSPSRLLAGLVKRVLDATPVNMHRCARDRRGEARLI
jgi:hypothetical protein